MKKGNKSQGKLLVNGKLIELHKLTPDFEKLRIKNWIAKLRNFKPIFDRIRLKSYPDALRFWDEQVIPHSENNPLPPLRNNLPITFDLLSDKTYFHFTEDLIRNRLIETNLSKDEFVKDKNNLSISPVNEEEEAIFNEWFYNRYSKIWYDLEGMKEKVFSILEKSPDKNKYLTNEIEKLEKNNLLNKSNRSIYRDNLTLKLEGVLLRGELPDWKKTHREELMHFAKMKFEMEKLVFLKLQLKNVEEGGYHTGGKLKHSLKNLSWEKKSELCELIFSLWKSNRILNNGTPIQLNDLINLFENLFNTELSKYHTLLNQVMTSNKKTLDKKYLSEELLRNSIISELLEHEKNWKPKVKN